MAKWKSGESGNPEGMRVGMSQKKTLILKSFTTTIVDGGMERFQEELNGLKGRAYVDAFLALLEYVHPKLQRVENTGDANGITVITVKVPDETNPNRLA